jgi:hypothetical protein
MASEFELNVFRQELRELLIRHQVSLGVDLEGDTHGLLQTFVVIEDRRGNKEHELSPGRYLDASDLA